MYTREEVKAITDKVLEHGQGRRRRGEVHRRRTVRHAVGQFDDHDEPRPVRPQRHRHGARRHRRSAARTRATSATPVSRRWSTRRSPRRQAGRRIPNLPELLGPQDYIPVDAALPDMVNFGPGERARMVKDSIDIAEARASSARATSRRTTSDHLHRELEGSVRVLPHGRNGLHSDVPHARRSGLRLRADHRHQGHQHDRREGAHARSAANKALKSRNAKAIEPGRYTVILEPRANARFLSLMTGIFGGRRRFAAASAAASEARRVADRRVVLRPARLRAAALRRGRWWRRRWRWSAAWRHRRCRRSFMAGKKPGDKLFSDLFTLKSDIGNPILRQTTDRDRQQAGEAGDLGREGRSAHARRRAQPRERESEPRAGRHRISRSRT